MVLNYIKSIVYTHTGWSSNPPEKKAMKVLENIIHNLEDKYKDYALIKEYENLKDANSNFKTIEEIINKGVRRLEIHERWNFYENLIKCSCIKPETDSDLKDIIYDTETRRIVFEIYQNKFESGIIKDEKEEELKTHIRKQLTENKRLIEELRYYAIYNGLQEFWNDLINNEIDKLNKFSEYGCSEECKNELINQNNRLNSLKYCANNYITDVRLGDAYKRVDKFLPYSSETVLYKDVSHILEPMFEEIKGKIDADIASLLNEKIIQIFCERMNKDRFLK